MKYGISLAALHPSAWATVTEEADRLGYESVWLPEHVVMPAILAGSPHDGSEHPPVPPNVPIFDALAYLSFLAGRTTSIRLGTHVYNIGLRHPFLSARAVATLDIVSQGRALFGVGASWLESEWQAMGLDFQSRGRRVDEALEVCRRLWTEPVIEHHGEFFDFSPVMFEPKPVRQPLPAVVIGGDGPAAMRRAAEWGAWIPMNHGPEQLPAAIAKVTDIRATKGLPGAVEVTISGDVRSADDLGRYEGIGVDRLIVRPWERTSGAIEGLARFAEAVGIGRR